ncbi:TonB-dependent receptor [Dokdonella sp.]|uniref:TonB-dependent receptor plug domain-containing protein n=1 Tax=Dokdonella sp. TaxID=2291710 RepID=UPI0025BD413F|nr:TonB-dependent receptor [Dokdonella sp.]MBX3689697.1 TonB-dependent receptor [Dokdonella sp.]
MGIKHTQLSLAIAALGLAGSFWSGFLWAQDTVPTADRSDDKVTRLEGVIVVGSRRYDRGSDTDTAVPVDIVPMTKAADQGASFDLAQTLEYTTPSFTSVRQTGADNADSVDSAALRGLGSDQTLVLVNGKRLHSTSLVNLFGARNRGMTGTDLNTIPMLAIGHVEVLRDGAAAQYGSDAIAGVLNISLKRSQGCEAVAGYGQYSRGDGKNYIASGYCGFGVGDDGIVALTAEYLDRGRSNRTTERDPLRIIGDTAVKNGTFYMNGDIPFGDTAHFYFNGGIQNRDASSAAFARGGLGSDDIPSRNSAAMYPDGFVPFIDPYVQDRHVTGGIWWRWNDWRIDASQTFGYNKLIDTIRHTLNASIANYDLMHGGQGISPDHFNAGGFSFGQATTNLDFSRYFDDWFAGTNVAFGSEFRHENYQIHAGESGSWIDADGPGGGNAGSQGFPGFQPVDATDKNRNSWALYGDFEVNWTDRFMTDQALRYENYSDFGSTLIGKLAGAFRVTDTFLLRGSLSTGFRAPSLQQRYFSSTFTDFISGEPIDVVLAPNGGTVANAAGIPKLTEEKSRSGTLGFTWKPNDAISVTLDGYRIDIDDRIVLSGYFGTDDPNIGAILEGLGVGSAQFFVNSVDTRTQGLDLTVNHSMDLGAGHLDSFLAFNHTTTEVKRVHTPPSLVGREDSLLGERDRLFIEGGAPRSKAILGFDYTLGAWEADLKIIYFGPMTLGTFSGPPVPNQHYADKTSADLSITYNFNDNMKLTVGGQNILDKFPTRQNPDETDNGFMYESVQFGLNGAAWFARFAYKF